MARVLIRDSSTELGCFYLAPWRRESPHRSTEGRALLADDDGTQQRCKFVAPHQASALDGQLLFVPLEERPGELEAAFQGADDADPLAGVRREEQEVERELRDNARCSPVWMRLVDLQERLYSSSQLVTARDLQARKICILEEALQRNPRSEELLMRYLEETCAFLGSAREGLECWQIAAEAGPGMWRLCAGRLDYYMVECFPIFALPTAVDMHAQLCMDLERASNGTTLHSAEKADVACRVVRLFLYAGLHGDAFAVIYGNLWMNAPGEGRGVPPWDRFWSLMADTLRSFHCDMATEAGAVSPGERWIALEAASMSHWPPAAVECGYAEVEPLGDWERTRPFCMHMCDFAGLLVSSMLDFFKILPSAPSGRRGGETPVLASDRPPPMLTIPRGGLSSPSLLACSGEEGALWRYAFEEEGQAALPFSLRGVVGGREEGMTTVASPETILRLLFDARPHMASKEAGYYDTVAAQLREELEPGSGVTWQQELLRSEPENASAWMTLVRLLRASGRTGEALEEAVRIVDSRQFDACPELHLFCREAVEMLIVCGRLQEAADLVAFAYCPAACRVVDHRAVSFADFSLLGPASLAGLEDRLCELGPAGQELRELLSYCTDAQEWRTAREGGGGGGRGCQETMAAFTGVTLQLMLHFRLGKAKIVASIGRALRAASRLPADALTYLSLHGPSLLRRHIVERRPGVWEEAVLSSLLADADPSMYWERMRRLNKRDAGGAVALLLLGRAIAVGAREDAIAQLYSFVHKFPWNKGKRIVFCATTKRLQGCPVADTAGPFLLHR